jgi:hypothetical protein
MKKFIHEEKHDEWGYYCEYRFPNGYGAVVVQNRSTMGFRRGLCTDVRRCDNPRNNFKIAH